MSDAENNHAEYRHYSEIEYLLKIVSSGTPMEIERIQQRLSLFDQSHRHIPYLLLLHIVYYGTDFKEVQKKQSIENLLAQLYFEIIHGSPRNQLMDFIPPYYCLQLLIDLHISGYDIERLIVNLEIDPGSDLIVNFLEYGDCSVEGFPEALLFFAGKLDPVWKEKDQYLLEIAVACLGVYNFKGFHHININISKAEIKRIALNQAVMAYVEKGEMEEAFKVINSFKPSVNNVMYLDMSIVLAKQGKIDLIRQIRQNVSSPEQVIGVLCGLIAYHFYNDDISAAREFQKEAYEILGKIRNRFVRTMRNIDLIDFTFLTGDIRKADIEIERIIPSVECLPDKRYEKTVARRILLIQLIRHNRSDQAKQLNIQWNKTDADEKAPYLMQHIMDADLQRALEHELRIVSTSRRQDLLSDHFSKYDPVKYYDTAFKIAELKGSDEEKAESLLVIAKHQARSGLYSMATETKARMPVDSYHEPIEVTMPLYAISHGNMNEATGFAHLIRDEKQRLAIQLCMSPVLEKSNHRQIANEFMRDWAVNLFQGA